MEGPECPFFGKMASWKSMNSSVDTEYERLNQKAVRRIKSTSLGDAEIPHAMGFFLTFFVLTYLLLS
jgi:hypothetical protein